MIDRSSRFFAMEVNLQGSRADPAKLLGQCKRCDSWYGAEDDEYGTCSIKHVREKKRFITHGEHVCDEAAFSEKL